MADTTDIEALVAELRRPNTPVWGHGWIGEVLLPAVQRQAADALERQQAVVEAAQTIRASLRGDGWSEADLQTMARPGMADLMKALAALDAPPDEGDG